MCLYTMTTKYNEPLEGSQAAYTRIDDDRYEAYQHCADGLLAQKRCYSLVADLRGPVPAGQQHQIGGYRLNRHEYAHEQLLEAQYTWRQ